MRSGLAIIESRAGSLGRFMQAYAQLTKLPAPVLNPCYIPALINRVVTLENRLPVKITGGPEISVGCDEAQIEQVLINLIKNAVEAALEHRADGQTEAGVHVGWSKQGHVLDISVVDGGHGIANDNNLFVPFFTTKPTGSGIGLVLCRQIAENHGGAVTLKNRSDAQGSIASLRLPA